MSVAIVNGGIVQVNSVRNSLVIQGKSAANGWSYIAKCNYSVGQINGNMNLVPSGANIITDPDLYDAPMENTIGSNSPNVGSNLELI